MFDLFIISFLSDYLINFLFCFSRKLVYNSVNLSKYLSTRNLNNNVKLNITLSSDETSKQQNDT